MLTLIYDAYNGTPCADGLAHSVASDAMDLAKETDVELVTSSALVLTEIRAHVHQKHFPLESVKVFHRLGENTTEIKMDANGRMADWPTGFCDHMDWLLDALLSPPKADS